MGQLPIIGPYRLRFAPTQLSLPWDITSFAVNVAEMQEQKARHPAGEKSLFWIDALDEIARALELILEIIFQKQ